MSYKAAATHGQAEKGKAVVSYNDWISHHLNRPWHASVDANEVQFAKESLSLQTTLHPTAWMGRCSSAIVKKSLRGVILPGAHDCGTYSLTNRSDYGSDLQSVSALRYLSAVGLGKLTKGIVASWAVCQSADTRSQLYQGVRYFDLRIAALKDKFHIWHGLCGEEAITVFQEMALYAKQFPTEILILDLVPHHFNDFTEDHHRTFSELLYTTFGSTLCDATKLSPMSTMGDFWDSQTSVIILYAPPGQVDPRHTPFWWNPDLLNSHWPKQCKNSDQWMRWAATHLAERPVTSPLWVLQGVITPDAGIIAKFNGVSSVQDLSRLLNPRTVHLLAKSPNHDHNIIMVDFFDNCRLIPAIQWANIGGQRIFPDNHSFAGAGHQCHFQAISIPMHGSKDRYIVLAAAMNTNKAYFSAVMAVDLENPLPWAPSTHLRGMISTDNHYYSTLRLFHLDSSGYAVMATPSGAKILIFDSFTRTWALFADLLDFGSADGFGTPSPVYRSTLTALSATKQGSPAWITALTSAGLAVACITNPSHQLPVYRWSPPCEMLDPYFSDYAPLAVRSRVEQKKLIPKMSESSLSSSKVSLLHSAYTQVIPFYLFDRLHLLVQGPVSVLFPRSPAVYESESIIFICTCENGVFVPLALENMPPPVHRGSRPPSQQILLDDVVLGSPWHVEVIDNVAHLVARTSDGIRTWKFDGVGLIEIPIYRAFLDTFHWNEPLFACTLRTFVLNERLFFMGRSSAGLVLISLQDDVWVPAPGMAEFTDFGGWQVEEYAKSLQVTVMGPIAYVTGRCYFGVVTVRFDGADWLHWARPILKQPIQI